MCVFYKFNKLESSKEVPTTFSIRPSELNSDEDTNKAPFNVDLYMSLKIDITVIVAKKFFKSFSKKEFK
jgi:hypothetical protein